MPMPNKLRGRPYTPLLSSPLHSSSLPTPPLKRRSKAEAGAHRRLPRRATALYPQSPLSTTHEIATPAPVFGLSPGSCLPRSRCPFPGKTTTKAPHGHHTRATMRHEPLFYPFKFAATKTFTKGKTTNIDGEGERTLKGPSSRPNLTRLNNF